MPYRADSKRVIPSQYGHVLDIQTRKIGRRDIIFS